MKFTGANLCMVLRGLQNAQSCINNEIAICPDVYVYAEQLDELDTDSEAYGKLIERVKAALVKEGYDPNSLYEDV